MKEIITDLEQLKRATKPLEFLTDIGVEKDEGEAIIKDLKEVLEADKTILALSAPQIGIDSRIFCIRFNDEIKTFINPIITKKSGGSIRPETCVNMPGKEILIWRPDEITVVYYTDEFKYEDNKLMGPAARLFDQQIQLLDGVLPNELGLVSDVEEDGTLADLNEEEIKEIQEIYKQYISLKLSQLEGHINEDEDMAKKYTQLKFAEKVIGGGAVVVDQGHDRETMALKATKNAQQKEFSKINTKKFVSGRK